MTFLQYLLREADNVEWVADALADPGSLDTAARLRLAEKLRVSASVIRDIAYKLVKE